MAEKVTMMKLTVDLQCRKCYMKVKKVLCKYPQIRDQLYDEKNGTVTIKVVCCNPERLRDSLCCHGGGSIKSIEIVEPPKPKPQHGKPNEPENKPKPPPEKPNEPDNKPKPPPEMPNEPDNKPKPPSGPPKPPKQDPIPPPPPAANFPEPTLLSVFAYPSPAVPVGLLHGGGPGGPTGFYGRPIYDSYGWSGPSYGWSGPCYVGPHHECLGEEEASVCTIN